MKTAAAAAVGTLGRPVPSRAADIEIELSPRDAGPVISPHIYGHFIEHLGGVIYDGVWVGRNSSIPNVNGIRRQFVDDMKRIGAPNLRWPGGCFADGYHWRDGIGNAAARPRTYNYWQRSMPPGMDATETNQFGVQEFMHLCRLVGAEPYLAANVGSGSPREFHEWVQYCNAPAGTVSLATERAANGDPDPYRVRYWGVGNESWGCGGTMKPEDTPRSIDDLSRSSQRIQIHSWSPPAPAVIPRMAISAGPLVSSEPCGVPPPFRTDSPFTTTRTFGLRQ
jgi:alpha-N-arabinofuranosidase